MKKEQSSSKMLLRAVIDTNLFISGMFARASLSAKLQNAWIRLDFELVTSKEIIREIVRVLRYRRIQTRFNPTTQETKWLSRMIFRKAIITEDTLPKTNWIKEDPTDDKFIACAIEGKAEYIISRDKHLRNLKEIQGIKVTGVTDFLKILGQE